MRICIIDSDKEFTIRLKHDIEREFFDCDDYLLVKIVDNHQAIFELDEVDVIFLEVSLNEHKDGIRFARCLRHYYPSSLIVLISSCDKYVYDALQVECFQFMRKNNYDKDSEVVFNQLKNRYHNDTQRIDIVENRHKYQIKVKDIMYVLSIGHDLIIKTRRHNFKINLSLKAFFKKIGNNDEIVQIAKNLAINIKYINKIKNDKVITYTNRELDIGKAYKQELYNKFENYILK